MPGQPSHQQRLLLDGVTDSSAAGTGFPDAGQKFSTTSMTHQLHCLVWFPSTVYVGAKFPSLTPSQYMMGRIYSGVVLNITTDLPEDYHAHFLHCIDYLRQAVMCSGDVAIEDHDANDADDLGPLDGGWSGRHGEIHQFPRLSQ